MLLKQGDIQVSMDQTEFDLDIKCHQFRLNAAFATCAMR